MVFNLGRLYRKTQEKIMEACRVWGFEMGAEGTLALVLKGLWPWSEGPLALELKGLWP